MSHNRVDDLLSQLQKLQADLKQEIDQLLEEKRQQFRYRLERGKVRFEQGMKALHRRQREGLWRYLRHARLGNVLSAPIAYSLIVPLVLLDLMVSLYQQICFRVYGIPRVRRTDHIVIDRQYLAYLNIIEKLNCVYCGYGNGVIDYVREVVARTEQYWCPIKHARHTQNPHQRVKYFADYGDAEGYHRRLDELRSKWSDITQDTPDRK